MAAIGICWADGAWIVASWVDGAWTATAAADPLNPFLTDVLDVEPFFDLGGLQDEDLDVFLDRQMGFAETITHSGGTFAGIFTDHATEGGDEAGPELRMATDDYTAAGLGKGSTLTIRARTFRIDAQPRSGTGLVLCILTEIVP